MNKLMKSKLLVLALLPFLTLGCSDLFDKGDVEKSYDGPDVVAFADLESEVDEGDDLTVEVQFISSKGLANSDVTVTISVDGSSTAQAAHYSLSATSVTIPSGSATATFTIDFPADSGLNSGDEVTLVLTLDGGSVAAAENLDTKVIYIAGVDDTP